jgi:MFS family permease
VTLWLMGQSTNMGQLVLFSVMTNFLGGMQVAVINTLAGLFADEAERGRVFGILISTIPVGRLLGGLAAGPLVDQWGFVGLFSVAALVTILQPTASLLLEDKRVIRSPHASDIASPIGALRSQAFLFLFVASIVAFIASGVYGLGSALLMNNLGFDASAISSTLAASGLVTLPFPLVLGWLSDRIGRKSLLIVCYIASVASLITLAGASVLWHFWVSSALQAVLTASLGIGAALVTDLVSRNALGSGLSLFSATNWIGLIIGSALTGAAMQGMGPIATLLLGVLLASGAVLLVFLIRSPLILSPVPRASSPAGQ